MIDEMMIFKDGFGFQDLSRKVLSDVQIDVKVKGHVDETRRIRTMLTDFRSVTFVDWPDAFRLWRILRKRCMELRYVWQIYSSLFTFINFLAPGLISSPCLVSFGE